MLDWPRGLMDKASDFESEDCEFESRRGRPHILKHYYHVTIETICIKPPKDYEAMTMVMSS